jgi:hypothetical protein
MPCLGQRPDVGRGSEGKDYRDCGATQRCRQYGLADCMHTAESLVRTKSRRRSRGARQPIQLSPRSHGSSRRTSADGFLKSKAGFESPVSQFAAVLEPRSVLIASDFSQPFEKAVRHSLARLLMAFNTNSSLGRVNHGQNHYGITFFGSVRCDVTGRQPGE